MSCEGCSSNGNQRETDHITFFLFLYLGVDHKAKTNQAIGAPVRFHRACLNEDLLRLKAP